MLAMGIIAIPILFVLGLLTTNFALQAKSDGVMGAAHAGELVLERWKSRPYGELDSLVGTLPLLTTEMVGSNAYECSFSVSRMTPAAQNPTKK